MVVRVIWWRAKSKGANIYRSGPIGRAKWRTLQLPHSRNRPRRLHDQVDALMGAPSIELLWWSGCPSHPKARTMLLEAMTEAGLAPGDLVTIQMVTQEDADREHFIGSPTIRIDGVDIVPVGVDEPAALTCRLYFTAAGRPSPLPDRQIVVDAVAAATLT
jgi:hypothetical protein